MGMTIRTLGLLLILLFASPGSSAADAVSVGQIAFRSSKNSGVFVVNSDGTQLRRLTRGVDHDPVWSPDGTRIAFVRWIMVGIDRDEIVRRPAIHVVDADGSGLSRLTPPGTYDEEPSWSPDGQRLVFVRSADVGDGLDADIWVMSRRRAKYSPSHAAPR